MAWHTFLCPRCYKEVSVSVEATGKVSNCNLCGAAIAVPTTEQDASLREEVKRRRDAEAEEWRRNARVNLRRLLRSARAGVGKTINLATRRWKALLAGLAVVFLLIVIVGLFKGNSTLTPSEYSPEKRAAWERERAKKREEDDKKAAFARAEEARQKAEAEKAFREKLSMMDPAERLKIVNAKDEKGSTLLHKTISANDKTFVETLLGYGADVRSLDGDGALPILYAVSSGNPEIVRLLLERGADPNARNMIHVPGNYVENEVLHTEGRFVQTKETPLFLAACKRNNEVILLLTSKGAQVNAVDDEGRTPLDCASNSESFGFSGAKERAEVLRRNGGVSGLR